MPRGMRPQCATLPIRRLGLVWQQEDKKSREVFHQRDSKWHFNSLGGFSPLEYTFPPPFGNQVAKYPSWVKNALKSEKIKENKKYLDK
jgi:hypothetical protein